MRFGKAVVKHRILILILTAALLVPSVFGMIGVQDSLSGYGTVQLQTNVIPCSALGLR